LSSRHLTFSEQEGLGYELGRNERLSVVKIVIFEKKKRRKEKSERERERSRRMMRTLRWEQKKRNFA